MFTKDDIKTGMFGTTADNQEFVIVEGLIVYKAGGYDYVADLQEDLSFREAKTYISKLYKGARSFRMMEDKKNHKYIGVKCIYDRYEEKQKEPTEMTIAEIEKALNIKNLKIVERK